VPRLVPAEAQQPTCTFCVALLQQLDRQALEDHGEAAHRLGPGKGHLSDPVGGALDAWRPGMQVGQERTAVEMAPGPLLGVVVDRKLRPAFGTGKPSGFRMLGPQLDTAPVYGQLDPTHLPWRDESQQVAVELGVTYHPIVAEDLHVDPANISSGNSPTHKPEAPFF